MIYTRHILAAVLLAALTTNVQAAPIPLSDLLDDGDPNSPPASIVVGDKAFTNFSYLPSGDVPQPESIQVETIDDNGLYGIRFTGPFRDEPGGDPSDAAIIFDVVVQEQGNAIAGAHMFADVTLFEGAGFAGVTETITSVDTNTEIAQFNVFNDGSPNIDLINDVTFGSTWQQIRVRKDILLEADDTNGVRAAVSILEQRFPQVPEPSSLILLASGLLMFVVRRK